MSTFLYITGLIIGIAVFLYLLSLYEAGKEKIQTKTVSCDKENSEDSLNPDTIAFRNRPAAAPGTRICPICGSSLTKYEGLYASKISHTTGTKLMIMGCRFCYRDKEIPDKPGKSAL